MKIVCQESSRIDIFLAKHLNEARNQVSNLIKSNGVFVNEMLIKKPSLKLVCGDVIAVDFPKPSTTKPKFDVDFDIDILHEDEHILVLNKPPFLTIHQAPSVKEATLVDWLKQKEFRLSTLSGEERHGIVHRLDKQTSGAIVVAKSNEAHKNLSLQLENKSMGRYYLALVDLNIKQKCIVEKSITRNPKNRLIMTAGEQGRYAKSAFFPLQDSKCDRFGLIAVKLYTGRTHQIRAHLKSISRHILGDDLYGFKTHMAKISRVMLHAYVMYLNHPITNEPLLIKAPLFDDFVSLYDKYFLRNENEEIFKQDYIIRCFNDADDWLCK